MNSDIAATLKRARISQGLSIRDLAARAGVSTATVQRVEGGPDELQAKTLRKLTEALGLPNARLDESGEWTIPGAPLAVSPHETPESRIVHSDGRTVLVLDVPPGFLDGLDEDALEEVKQDALLEVMRLARAVKRRPVERG